MKIAIGNDHAAIQLKQLMLSYLSENNQLKVADFGAQAQDKQMLDYPDYALEVCSQVASGEYDMGILLCGTGVGMSMAANKMHGIRAVVCSDPYTAQLSRSHNDANILCIGERVIGSGLAQTIIEAFIETPFEGGRHKRRVDKIMDIGVKSDFQLNITPAVKNSTLFSTATPINRGYAGKLVDVFNCRRNITPQTQLYQLLGDLPPRDNQITAHTLSKEERPGYILEKLSLDLGHPLGEAVPAYFVMPKNTTGAKPPVVLFCHSHGGKYHLGKDELLEGNTYMYHPPYAEALTAAGYAALCIDSPLFGERSGRDELSFFKEMLWQGKIVWGLMVYDHLKAMDYLHMRDDVDLTRIAALGMSMGSTMAWWLAALDERIKVCVDICCLTDFHTLIEAGGLNGHGIYYYVPGLLKHFDTTAINAMIAPRPHLSVNGALDALTPEDGLDKIDMALRQIYEKAGAPDAWLMNKYPVQHEETAAMRTDIMKFLRKWL